ncbi:ABC transporter substrate-binding protein [Veronia nyctiphanis]|uniref:ABC transporter substrate-binding protein n=1 Tax=Veronia nyctiphanis TaxID=1278244 RepID=A0A4Q0YPU2_9GAMM|nr:extracellular solute-binding protein [Veronia nyctiphanis]RXJ72004.1 ABC transporter substrate-binding protein [Veronia nyctiphanis]
MKKVNILATAIAMSFGAGAAELPTNLKWETNTSDPVFASDEAKRGGTFRSFLTSFPLTYRTVGPDSNGAFRRYLLDYTPGLVDLHPNTDNWIPQIANEWAYGDDNKTVYFKLNPKAKWTDGEPITADDFVYKLTLMRSKDIVAPWYNNYYTKQIESVIKFDDHTIAIVSTEPKNKRSLMEATSLTPVPKHFYKPSKDENGDGVDDNFVKRFNYKAAPLPGPYYLASEKKGKSVTLKHVGEDWWGYENKYYQNRFNVDKVRFTVIRDVDLARQKFEKGELDTFALVRPTLWHDKSNGEAYQNGYIQKFWGFNARPQGAGGIWINTQHGKLADINIRKGIEYASDFEGLIEKLIRGDYSRKPHAMGFGHGDYDLKGSKAAPFDLDKAVEYFSKAGFDKIGTDGIRVNADGERLSFELTYLAKVNEQRMAYIQEQAKLAGLELRLKLVDGASGFKYVREKKHELAFFDMGTGPVPQYRGYFHSDNAGKPQTNSFTNFSTPELDVLIEQFRAEFDIDKKKQLSRDIQKIVQEASVLVPGYMAPFSRGGHWRWVKFPSNPMTKQTISAFDPVEISNFWIDTDVKKETEKMMKQGKTLEPIVVIDEQFKS